MSSEDQLLFSDVTIVDTVSTPEERVAMVGRLTLDAWARSGRPMPTYRRSELPGRVLRPRPEPAAAPAVTPPPAR